jgi:hypothetical protein
MTTPPDSLCEVAEHVATLSSTPHSDFLVFRALCGDCQRSRGSPASLADVRRSDEIFSYQLSEIRETSDGRDGNLRGGGSQDSNPTLT